MENLKRIIARITIIAIVISAFCLPAYASDGKYSQKTGFWNWILWEDHPLAGIIGYTTGAMCSKSEDKYHHADSYEKVTQDGYYTCVCSYCGKEFTAYEDDVKQSYNAQVAELPGTGFDSDGNLYWQATFEDLIDGRIFNLFRLSADYSISELPYRDDSNFVYYSLFDDHTVKYEYLGPDEISFYMGIQARVVGPIPGTYYIVRSLHSSYSLDGVAGKPFYYLDSTSGIGYNSGSFDFFNYRGPLNDKAGKSFIGYFYLPVYKIVPTPGYLADTFKVDSRPTSITGNYGIIGDNGEINKVDNQTIVNETNNTVYNPVTGTTTNITDWQYDYSTRTYTVTLDSGTKQTITYGDENITIKEGDTIYNVYYIIEGTGETPSPSPSGCVHVWTETSRTDPTCIAPGSASYSCSQCGATKTETLKALGHTWKVERTVLTTYDEQGNLIEQGYTIYKCSVCGEQYKDEHSTGPPGDASDDGESLWDFLLHLSELLGEKLAGVADLILRLFDEVSRLFNRFVDFLGVVFPYLPPEIMLLLTFGVAAVVVVGIIKAFRR